MRTADFALRDGVGASCVALPPGSWPTLLDFMVARFPAIGRSEWLLRMQSGAVFDDRGVPVTPQTAYQPNRQVFYYRSLDGEVAIPFQESVLFQDDWLVVADKPHFLPVTPSGIYLQETLLVRLKRRLGIDTLTPIHRIDRDTAGLVVFCIVPAARDRYQALFRDRAVTKTYEALAPWRDDLGLPLRYCSRLAESAAFMQMTEVAGEPNAETGIDLIERRGVNALYRLQPATGQKHQLRAHMAALGIGILNDRIYPTLQPAASATASADYSQPLQLLARALSFVDPVTGKVRHFESERVLQG